MTIAVPMDGVASSTEAKPAGRHAVARLRLSRLRLSRLANASLLVIPILALIFDGYLLLRDPQYELGKSVFDQKTSRLVFTVAGHKYEVRSPNVPLTQQETDAYWYYADYWRFSVYAVDGPMAVDP